MNFRKIELFSSFMNYPTKTTMKKQRSWKKFFFHFPGQGTEKLNSRGDALTNKGEPYIAI